MMRIWADQEVQIWRSKISSKIFVDWGDLVPLAAGEADRLHRRHGRVEKLGVFAERARVAFSQILNAPDQVKIRPAFMCRHQPAPAEDGSDRGLPEKNERPPASRLISPRGIALRLYLTALLVGQTRSPGEKPANHRPLADPDQANWMELFAVPVERHSGKVVIGPRDKRIRQLHDAIQRLASPDMQLAELPNISKATKKYEGFTLMHEQGKPFDGGDNDPYTVPEAAYLPYLPSGFFKNGWVHVLEDSEIVFLLMLTTLRHLWPSEEFNFISGDARILHFGLGRDAYQSHQMLERLGLVSVREDENRDFFDPGRVRGYDKNKPPKLHRFKILNEGFDAPAIRTTLDVIDRRLSKREGVASTDQS